MSEVQFTRKLPPGSQRRPFPTAFRPQLATLVDKIPAGRDWIYELKFDGYRILSRCDRHVQLLTRRGHDWTDRFSTIARALADLQLPKTILDGEVVMLDSRGASDFQALQNLLNTGHDDRLVYYVFDVPYLKGYDLSQTPQLQRKEVLRGLLRHLPATGPIRYSDHIRGSGKDVVAHACQQALEGVVGKHVESFYQQRRTRNWIKFKCLQRQEFIIVGWTDPEGSRVGFGSLLLGYYESEVLQYAGRVGTGFERQTLDNLRGQLDKLTVPNSPLARPLRGAASRGVHWVTPTLVAEIEFSSWTADRQLRHPSFKGLREDKPPRGVVREVPSRPPVAKRSDNVQSERASSLVAGVAITHPQRIVYPEQGVTKGELALYFAEIADWMLPYVVGRPISVVRCPQGRAGQCFFQKHANHGLPPAVGSADVKEQGAVQSYLTLTDRSGLVSLAQLGVLEIHPWASRNDRLSRPDMLIFDLDPGPQVAWETVLGAAREVRARLADAGLTSFVRTTGGAGLHVVAPLVRRTGWQVTARFAKAFAQAMSLDRPQVYLATARKAAREGRIYVDYLRNARGATAIANYSTRARAGAPVATPLRWAELTQELKPNGFHIGNIRQRLHAMRSDPWAEFSELRQSLTRRALQSVNADID